MTRCLLTGAGGFVGSHVLRHLLANTDWHIVCPVTFRHRGVSDRISLAMDDMPDAAERVHVVRCDLSAPISNQTRETFGDIEYILNVASESHVDRSIDQPAEFIMNNVALVTHLYDYARTLATLRIIVQVSTDEVYGPAPGDLAHYEWRDVHKPSNPYSASKAAQEDIAFAYWRTYGLPLVISNTMNIFGETQDSEKFVPRTLDRVLKNQAMTIHSSPDGVVGSRFYLHTRNQADGLLFLARYFDDHPSVLDNPVAGVTESLRYADVGGDAVPPRFHIVGEREIDNLQMAHLIARAANMELEYELVDFHSSRPGHDLRYALEGTRIADLGWKPPMSLDDSLASTIKWTLAHREWLL